MSVSRFAAASGVSALVLASLIAATPASATTIDVTGVEFNFGNPVDTDILPGAEDGDTYLYENVATVNGTQIDARVGVTDVYGDLIAATDWLYLGPTSYPTLDEFNTATGQSVTEGCYSNAGYVADPYTYDTTQFTASDKVQTGYVVAVDEYQGDDTDSAINNDMNICTWDGAAGTFDVLIEFLVDGSPVTLNNLTLNVTDIDGGQHVTFYEPAPTSYEIGTDSVLIVDEAVGYTYFYGEQSSDDEVDPLSMYAADVTFDGVSSISYQFGYEDGELGNGGSLSVAFSSFYHPNGNLAATGVDATPTGFAGLAALVAGGAIVIARRVRRRA